jgi:hypothetical protein
MAFTRNANFQLAALCLTSLLAGYVQRDALAVSGFCSAVL